MTYDVELLRREEFPWAARGDAIYLNHASTGALPQRTVRTVTDWIQRRAEPWRIGDGESFEMLAKGRRLVAQLVGADAGEIALMPNTGVGINLAAFALPLQPGDVVLTPDLEFPANVYPWMALAERRGVIYRRVPCLDGVVDEARLLRELEDPAVKLLALSWVGFATGARVDLEALGRACRARGVWFVVDAIQGLGVVPLDLRRCHVDILACGAQKWLLSPWGTGFTYVRRELVARLDPQVVGWVAVRGSDDFTRLLDYDLAWRDDARRFELLTLGYQDFAGMNESLALLLELGPARVAAHVESLVSRIIAWAAEHPEVELVTPAEPARRAGIVSLRLPDPPAAAARLREAKVAFSLREGSIRLSPHCYTNDDDIDRALAAIA
jgi:selenocysteine lyase/cysteine desulfurase